MPQGGKMKRRRQKRRQQQQQRRKTAAATVTASTSAGAALSGTAPVVMRTGSRPISMSTSAGDALLPDADADADAAPDPVAFLSAEQRAARRAALLKKSRQRRGAMAVRSGRVTLRGADEDTETTRMFTDMFAGSGVKADRIRNMVNSVERFGAANTLGRGLTMDSMRRRLDLMPPAQRKKVRASMQMAGIQTQSLGVVAEEDEDEDEAEAEQERVALENAARTAVQEGRVQVRRGAEHIGGAPGDALCRADETTGDGDGDGDEDGDGDGDGDDDEDFV